MFREQSYHTIDDKGRIIIPVRFRDVIADSGEQALMLAQLDGGLFAYTLPRWQEIENKILAMPRTTKEFRRFRRVLIGGSAKCALDKQDRILVPPALREYAGLEGEIALVGVLDHIEIWSRKRLEQEAMLLENDLNSEEFADQVAELGL